jgi:hypothetical protein
MHVTERGRDRHNHGETNNQTLPDRPSLHLTLLLDSDGVQQ